MSLLRFCALIVKISLLSMEGQRALRFHQKYLNLCSEDEQRSCGFGTTQGLIFRWTIPLSVWRQVFASFSLWEVPIKMCFLDNGDQTFVRRCQRFASGGLSYTVVVFLCLWSGYDKRHQGSFWGNVAGKCKADWSHLLWISTLHHIVQYVW